LIANTLAALRPGGAFVMNVSGVAGNDLPKHAAELARQHGVTVEGRTIDIGGTYKLGATRAESELEDLLILRKAGRMPRTKPAVSGGVK
jgi:hypothetical protein